MSYFVYRVFFAVKIFFYVYLHCSLISFLLENITYECSLKRLLKHLFTCYIFQFDCDFFLTKRVWVGYGNKYQGHLGTEKI